MKRASRNALFFLLGFGLVALPAFSFAAVPAPVTSSLSAAAVDCVAVGSLVLAVAAMIFSARCLRRALHGSTGADFSDLYG